MATDLIRETAFGQIVRYATGNRVFLYPEEKPGFQCPSDYINGPDEKKHRRNSKKEESTRPPRDVEEALQPTEPTIPADKISPDSEDDSSSSSSNASAEKLAQQTSNLHRTESLPYSPERLEVERIATLERAKSHPIHPTVTSDGTILVDWYVFFAFHSSTIPNSH